MTTDKTEPYTTCHNCGYVSSYVYNQCPECESNNTELVDEQNNESKNQTK